MTKQEFERTTPRVNISTIGHVHGKTTLIDTISAILSNQGDAECVDSANTDKASEKSEHGITINKIKSLGKRNQ